MKATRLVSLAVPAAPAGGLRVLPDPELRCSQGPEPGRSRPDVGAHAHPGGGALDAARRLGRGPGRGHALRHAAPPCRGTSPSRSGSPRSAGSPTTRSPTRTGGPGRSGSSRWTRPASRPCPARWRPASTRSSTSTCRVPAPTGSPASASWAPSWMARSAPGSSWFPGRADLVEPYEEAFREFLASVRLEGGAGAMPAGPPGGRIRAEVPGRRGDPHLHAAAGLEGRALGRPVPPPHRAGRRGHDGRHEVPRLGGRPADEHQPLARTGRSSRRSRISRSSPSRTGTSRAARPTSWTSRARTAAPCPCTSCRAAR